MECPSKEELVCIEGIDCERWNVLCNGSKSHSDVINRISDALAKEFGEEASHEIAFHVSDWISDAISLVALHLRPEKFSDEEIRDIVEDLAIHANHHLMAATHWFGRQLQDVFELGLQIEQENPVTGDN